MVDQSKIAAIVLAAGKGKRMQSINSNKVVLPLGGKPMILYGIDLLRKFHVDPIVVVVGFAKESVMNVVGKDVVYVIQERQLGTGHAVMKGLQKLSDAITDVIVINGDDVAFYDEKTMRNLLNIHKTSNAAVTFLTLTVDNPYGLGRVLRDNENRVIAIREEKDASPQERLIKEVNINCYIFRVLFLKRYLKRIKKSSITGEYYVVTLVELAVKNNERVETLPVKIAWRGVNTPSELREAELLITNKITYE